MTDDDRDDPRRDRDDDAPEDEGGEPGARGGSRSRDADALPGAPGSSDTPLGDTDQHSDVPSQ